MITEPAVERAKYERAWAIPEYRKACHGLHLWKTRRDLFPDDIKSKRVVDIGCGTGRLVAALRYDGVDAYGVDIAANSVDSDVRSRYGDRFKLGSCLWSDALRAGGFDFGVCTDVMEHIPPEHVAAALENIGQSCGEVLFKIAHSPNHIGGDLLHLTLRPWSWWLQQMRLVGGAAEYVGAQARSGFEDSLIRWRPREYREPLFQGQSVAVLGSGLVDRVPAASVVAGANGGARVAHDLFGYCDVLATTSFLFREDRTTEEAATVESLRGMSFKTVFLDSKCGGYAEVARGMTGVSWLRMFEVGQELREQVVREAAPSFFDTVVLGDIIPGSDPMERPVVREEFTAAPTPWVSTGVWLACLAVASGASLVTTVGVTGESRDHAAADTFVLKALEAAGVEVLR